MHQDPQFPEGGGGARTFYGASSAVLAVGSRLVHRALPVLHLVVLDHLDAEPHREPRLQVAEEKLQRKALCSYVSDKVCVVVVKNSLNSVFIQHRFARHVLFVAKPT